VSRTRAAAAVALSALVLVLLPAAAAEGSFASTGSGSLTASSSTLQPPTSLVNGSTCLLVARTLRVTWTPSTSARATGYQVSVTVNGSTTTETVTPVTATSWTKVSLLGLNQTYLVGIRTYLGNWTSSAATISFTC
jgi:hypothetical protein